MLKNKNIIIKNILLSKVKKFSVTEGNVFHAVRKKDLGFEGNYAIHGSISPNNKRIYIGMFGESLPSSENKIELDKVRKDKWGIPLPKIIYKWSENEVKMWLDQKKVFPKKSPSSSLPSND